MKKTRFFLIFSPLVLGILIYLLYRSKNLYYYNIIEFLKISGHIDEARSFARVYRRLFPNWVIYSLPDGLWLFSTGAAFLVKRKHFFFNLFCFNLIFGTSLAVEFLQKHFGGHGTKIGTYDHQDVIAYIYAYFAIVVLSIIINIFSKKEFSFKGQTLPIYENFRYLIIFSLLGILANML